LLHGIFIAFQLAEERVIIEPLVQRVLVDDQEPPPVGHQQVGVEHLQGRIADGIEGFETPARHEGRFLRALLGLRMLPEAQPGNVPRFPGLFRWCGGLDGSCRRLC